MNKPEQTGVCAGEIRPRGIRHGSAVSVASICGGAVGLPPQSGSPGLPGSPNAAGQRESGGSRADSGIAVYAFTARGAALGAGLAERFADRGFKAVLHLSAGASGAASTSGLTSAASVTGPDSAGGTVNALSAEAVPQALTDAPGVSAGTGPVLFSGLHALLTTTFNNYGAHIFIGATGIAVRGIAPFLKSKAQDPAVLVLDQQGRHVISLLSGHLGGANALCLEVAELLGADPVISTATDLENLPAIDLLAQEAGLYIANLEAVKAVSAAVLDGRPVRVDDPDNWLPQLALPVFHHLPPSSCSGTNSSSSAPLCPQAESQPSQLCSRLHQVPEASRSPYSPLVRVSHLVLPTAPDILLLHPKNLWVGLGCKRGTPLENLKNALEQLFARLSLSLHSLAGFASISQKSDESGLLELAQGFALPLRFFSAEELAAVPTPSLSPKALELFGTPSVAEAAALLAAGPVEADGPLTAPLSKNGKEHVGVEAELFCPKQVFAGITLAVAKRGSGSGPA